MASQTTAKGEAAVKLRDDPAIGGNRSEEDETVVSRVMLTLWLWSRQL